MATRRSSVNAPEPSQDLPDFPALSLKIQFDGDAPDPPPELLLPDWGD
jgi:hypothetical protein